MMGVGVGMLLLKGMEVAMNKGRRVWRSNRLDIMMII